MDRRRCPDEQVITIVSKDLDFSAAEYVYYSPSLRLKIRQHQPIFPVFYGLTRVIIDTVLFLPLKFPSLIDTDYPLKT